MRVLVCGGRNFSDTIWAHKILDDLDKEIGITTIIEGDARGADRIAGYWARKHRKTDLKYRANWDLHGRSAGPIRNKTMLEDGKPDLVVAFPGGRGTSDMIAKAVALGIPVRELTK